MIPGFENPAARTGDGPPAPWISEASVWQEVESGGYRIDLPFWTAVCADAKSPVLDLGCGTGRVSRHLMAAGYRVIGVELDPGIAADFARRTGHGDARVVIGDAAGLDRLLPAGDRFDRILLPQQLIQIVGGESARSALLAAVARRLAPDGIAAFALVPDLPTGSLELDLKPDELASDGWLYRSRPVSIEATATRVEITRIRERIAPSGSRMESASIVTFCRLDPETFMREAGSAGLEAGGRIVVPATDDHTGSVISLCAPGGP